MKRAIAIARKDVLQALRNRYIVGILLLSVVAGACLKLALSGPEVVLHEIHKEVELMSFVTSMVVLTPIAMVCAIVMPLLMVEEKELKTLRFLRVSPASMMEILAGKALVGVAFGTLMGLSAVVVLGEAGLLLSPVLIVALALASGAFASIGLLASAYFQTALQSNTWSALPMVFLMIGFLAEFLAPMHVAGELLKLLPTYSAGMLLRAAISGNALDLSFSLHALYLAFSMAAVFALTHWLYGREN